MNLEDKFNQIRKGLLEYAVLQVISSKKVYTADILKALSQTDFATQEGTLYPLLSSLRREGLVEYEWVESDAGPPRKYYQLTTQGKKQLHHMHDYWKKINDTIKNL